MDNKKINFKSVVIIIIVVCASSIAGKYIMDYIGRSKNVFDKELVETCDKINKKLPVMIDSETRADNLMPLPNNIFQYSYTLINHSKDQLDLEDLKSELRPLVLDFVKTSPNFKDFRDKKVTIKYLYRDMDGQELFIFTFDHNDYKE
jgi:GTP-dependent phosphoenolpyruvate carboxykinase